MTYFHLEIDVWLLISTNDKKKKMKLKEKEDDKNSLL